MHAFLLSLALLVGVVEGPLSDHDEPILPGVLVEIKSDAPPDAAVIWDAPDELDYRTYENERVLVFSSGLEDATFRISCLIIQIVDGKPKVSRVRHKIVVKRPGPPPNPPTATLDADKTTLYRGQSATLTWTTSNADSAKLNGQPVALSGSQSITPDKTTTCTLVAAQGSYEVTAQRIITVSDLPPPAKIDRVTYVYEKDQGGVPPGVSAALIQLNSDASRKILASEVDDDVRNAAGAIPEQYKLAFDAAGKVGVPVLVVQGGNEIVRLVKAPKTAAEVLEAVKP